MPRPLDRATFLGIAAAGSVIGATTTAPERLSAADPSVRFLTTYYEATATPVFADQGGFFKKAGLDVNLGFLGNGAAILSALVSGATDVGVATPLSLATAHQRGLPVVAIAPGALYRRESPAQLLVVAKDSSIKSARDLSGKTVAVVDLRTTAQMAIEAWVDGAGGNAKTINFIEMPVSVMPSAINSGRIDAGFSIEPALSEALKTTRALGDPQAVIAPQFLIQAYVTTIKYAEEYPGVVKRLANALRASATWANSHPSESAAIVSRVDKVANAGHMVRSYYAEQLSPKDLQPVIDLAVRYGFLSSSFPATDLIWSGK